MFFSQPGVGNFVCSAASIGGHGVLTAGHCVADGATGAWYENRVFVPAYSNGKAPYGQWTANHLWRHPDWVDVAAGGGDFRFDIGGAVLNKKLIDGVKRSISWRVGSLGFAWNQDNHSQTAHWALMGFPAAPPFNGAKMFICQASFAYNGRAGVPDTVGVGCDMTGGCSGGPWIRDFDKAAGSANYVSGVNSYRRCVDPECTTLFVHELFSPYFDNTAKLLRDCLVNSVPNNPADPNAGCVPGS